MKNLVLILLIIIVTISCKTQKETISKFDKQEVDKIALVVHQENNAYFTDIDEAIETAVDGDTVYIKEGVYQLEKAIGVWEKTNISIIGIGNCKLICNNIDDNVIWVSSCKNVLIKNIHATHTEPSDGQSCTGNVFALDMGKNITIEDCDINGCGAIGVYVWGTTNIILKNDELHDNTSWAVQYDGYGMLNVENNSNVHFINCNLHDNGGNNHVYE